MDKWLDLLGYRLQFSISSNEYTYLKVRYYLM